MKTSLQCQAHAPLEAGGERQAQLDPIPVSGLVIGSLLEANSGRLPMGEFERDAVSPEPGGGGGVLRFITAGSVDDGKSTLIGRLLHDTRQILSDQLAAVYQASRRRGFDTIDLSLLTDGLEAEREQGITIDVAYRYFATAGRKFIIADTPGHEQYTRNMVTGASTADAAIILADAEKGLLPQSKRHLYLSHLLGIRDIIVAVNKMDLVGYRREVFEVVRRAFADFARQLGVEAVRFVPISALRGNMVVERGGDMAWYQGPTLLEMLESLEPVRTAAALPFRFSVQLVQRAAGGRAYLGRVQSGIVRAGDEMVVLPSGRRVAVASVRGFEGERESAQAGDSVALTLAEETDVTRGDLIAAASNPPRVSQVIEATLVWLVAEPLVNGGRYLLKGATRTVRAKVTAIRERVDVQTLTAEPVVGRVALNDIVRATLSAQQPLAVDAYRENRSTGAFILIDETTNQTIAAGMIE
jgi:sulfate adenylyltransferase subunit 1